MGIGAMPRDNTIQCWTPRSAGASRGREGASMFRSDHPEEEIGHMVISDRLNRRRLTQIAGGMAGALAFHPSLRAYAQDAEESEEGVEETTEQEGKLNVTWWSHT